MFRSPKPGKFWVLHIYINRRLLFIYLLYSFSSGRLHYSVALSLFDYIDKDTDYIPWKAGSNSIDYIRRVLLQNQRAMKLFKVGSGPFNNYVTQRNWMDLCIGDPSVPMRLNPHSCRHVILYRIVIYDITIFCWAKYFFAFFYLRVCVCVCGWGGGGGPSGGGGVWQWRLSEGGLTAAFIWQGSRSGVYLPGVWQRRLCDGGLRLAFIWSEGVEGGGGWHRHLYDGGWGVRLFVVTDAFIPFIEIHTVKGFQFIHEI